MSSISQVMSSNAKIRTAFTLVELLVVVSIVVVVISLLVPALRGVQRAGSSATEMSLARQLSLAYQSYSVDHKGILMPGYYDLNPPMEARTEGGAQVPGAEAARYSWRLAPYLNYSLDGLIQDPWLREEIKSESLFTYFVSIYPSLGMNSTFIGGDSHSESLGFNVLAEKNYGIFYATRLSQVRRQSDLILFGSSRTNATFPGGPAVVEGYFRLVPPNIVNTIWKTQYPEDINQVASPGNPNPPNAKDWGYFSCRHGHRRAAIGYLDGSSGTLADGELRDMRRWADQADDPDWKLKKIN